MPCPFTSAAPARGDDMKPCRPFAPDIERRPSAGNPSPPSQRRAFRAALLLSGLSVVLALGSPVRASILGSLLAANKGANTFLPASRAYRLEGRRISKHRIVLDWRIARGYYLYQSRVRLRVLSPARSGIVFQLPPGVLRREPQGLVPVYYRRLRLTVRVRGNDDRPVVLKVGYQGCAEKGLCYPPQERTLRLALSSNRLARPATPASPPAIGGMRPVASASRSPASPRPQAPGSTKTPKQGFGAEILLFFLAGILLAFTPCGAPMLPILLATLGRAGGGTRSGRIRAALVYVLGVAATYGLLGVLAAAVGHDLVPFFENPWVVGAFALLFAFYGTAMLTGLRLELPERWRDGLSRLGGRGSGGLLGPLLLGVASALLASPCLTPAVAAGLTLAVYQGEAIQGGILLFVLGLGLGIPLLAAAIAAGTFWPRGGPWLTAVEHFLGFVLYGLALWFAARVLPTPVVLFLLGVLLALMAAFLYPKAGEEDEKSSVRFRRGFALALVALAFGEILGALAGSTHVLTPLRLSGTAPARSAPAETSGLHPLTVRTPRALARAFARARHERRSLLLDYDARWCVSCAIMDRTVFRRRRVVAALRPFLFVRADVTRDDRASARLLARYRVLGPPTFLYFRFRSGHLATHPTARLVGAQSTREFLAWLKRLDPPTPPSTPEKS